MRRTTILALVAMLSLAACDRGAEPELIVTTTSTSTTLGATEAAESTTTQATTDEPEETTTTALERVAVEGYEIQVQTTADEGRVLWVTIPAEDYTDLDLEDFVVGLVDDEEDLWEVHVLDDVAAVDAARVAEADRTDEEQALVDEHYLVSVTEGNVITFRGPFEAAGTFLIGS